MMKNKIVAVWGSSGSGKSAISLALAQELTEGKKKVALISVNTVMQSMRILLPFENDNVSVGKILQIGAEINETNILQCMGIHNQNSNLCFFGLSEKDTILSYPKWEEKNIIDFLNLLSRIVDYTIVDCNTNYLKDTITDTALQLSDYVIRCITADIKGVAFANMVMPAMRNIRYKWENQISVVNLIKKFTAVSEFQKVYGNSEYYFPYSDEVEIKHMSGSLMRGLSKPTGVRFEKGIKSLAKEVG